MSEYKDNDGNTFQRDELGDRMIQFAQSVMKDNDVGRSMVAHSFPNEPDLHIVVGVYRSKEDALRAFKVIEAASW